MHYTVGLEIDIGANLNQDQWLYIPSKGCDETNSLILLE